MTIFALPGTREDVLKFMQMHDFYNSFAVLPASCIILRVRQKKNSETSLQYEEIDASVGSVLRNFYLGGQQSYHRHIFWCSNFKNTAYFSSQLNPLLPRFWSILRALQFVVSLGFVHSNPTFLQLQKKGCFLLPCDRTECGVISKN